MADLDPVLAQLADAFSIATEYWDWRDNHVEVPAHTIVAVLAGLGVDASTPEAASAALHDHHEQPWRRMLPPFLALRERRTASVWVHVPHGDPVETWIDLESGGRRDGLRQLENWTPPREVAGTIIGEASFEVPDDLPLGYHTLHARSGHRSAAMPLIITPQWLGFPERMGARRGWGLATQLYSVRSRQSWGVGDLADLEDLAVWSAAEQRADFVLVNPLHAAEPVAPARAVALPADEPPVRQPDLPAGRTDPRVRQCHPQAAGQDRSSGAPASRSSWPTPSRSTGTGPGRPSARPSRRLQGAAYAWS